MKVARRMIGDAGPQSLAQFFRSLRNIGQAFQERAQIKTRAHRKHRNAASTPQVIEYRDGHLPVSAGSRVFGRSKNIDQVVRNSVALGEARLRRADIEAFVELR